MSLPALGTLLISPPISLKAPDLAESTGASVPGFPLLVSAFGKIKTMPPVIVGS
jgi:hypothetical protein